ncbi:hypothetical protein AAFF_G00023310 [Aldrovandia affinis]|uniref:Uncharacterized protein n=1 Tax=Aldrovandia affinis TaxID=143900 RepID=A0AAD7WZM7_9TELE|nr:hypothetical protein AAFF_G00023310 [Aldrovandia affinis]
MPQRRSTGGSSTLWLTRDVTSAAPFLRPDGASGSQAEPITCSAFLEACQDRPGPLLSLPDSRMFLEQLEGDCLSKRSLVDSKPTDVKVQMSHTETQARSS